MKENLKKLEQQIELLLKQYEHSKTVNSGRMILTSLQSMLELYKSVEGKELLKIDELKVRNPYYYQKYKEYNNHKRNLFIQNFMENRGFYNQFLCNIINEFDFFGYDYDDLCLPIQTHEEKELEEILKDYSQRKDKNSYEFYQKLKEQNRIFITNDTCPFVSYDYYNNMQFIGLTSYDSTIENVINLIHEMGHLEDLQDLTASKIVDYSDISIFGEVNALLREKEFYDYLLENHIYPGEIRSEVLLEPETILECLINLITYCNVPKSYLNETKYMCLKDEWIEKSMNKINREEVCVSIYSFEQLIFYDSLVYSVGDLLATYFLEHPDKYLAFRTKRYSFFHPKLFHDLDITSQDIIKSLYKRYEKYR